MKGRIKKKMQKRLITNVNLALFGMSSLQKTLELVTSGPEIDLKAIENDWATVGAGIRNAMDKVLLDKKK